MMRYDEMTKRYFLEHQDQLFDEPVALDMAEAEAFLDELDAVLFDRAEALLDYMDRLGVDVSGMDEAALKEQAEVFTLPDGRLLFVEG